MSEPPEDVAIQAALEEQLDALPLVKHQYSLVTPEDHVPADDQDIGWYYTRPAATSPGPHSLMASTFRRPGMIAIPPLAFAKNDDSEAVLFYHLGDGLSGHKGIVHGGVIATLMDDSLARNVSGEIFPLTRPCRQTWLTNCSNFKAFLSLPSKTGVTASLNVDYLKPTKTDQVCKACAGEHVRKRDVLTILRYGI